MIIVVLPCGPSKENPELLDNASNLTFETAVRIYKSKPGSDLMFFDYQVRHPLGGPTLGELCKRKAEALNIPYKIISNKPYTAVMDMEEIANLHEKLVIIAYSKYVLGYFSACLKGSYKLLKRKAKFTLISPDIEPSVPGKAKLTYKALGTASIVMASTAITYRMFKNVMVSLNKNRLTKGFVSTL